VKISDDVKQKICDLRERWEDEHVRSAEMYSLLPRVKLQLESALEVREWGRVKQLRDRLNAILETKDPLICDDV